MDHLDNLDPVAGLYPLLYNISSGATSSYFGNVITLGSNADSFYEYLLKQWLQSNRTDNRMRILYDEAIQGTYDFLLRKSKPSESWYISHFEKGVFVNKMDHLTCFLPGTVALGTICYYDSLNLMKAPLEKHTNVTCY